MELKQLMHKRPAVKQAVRFDDQGRIEEAVLDGVVSAREVMRLREASARIGRQLGLGHPTSLAVGDPVTALVVVESAGGATAVIEATRGDDLDAHAAEVRAVVAPGAAPFNRRHGFFEVRR